MPATFTNHHIGKPFIEISSVESTNNYAMQCIHKGLAQHGYTYFAHEQTAGKGQRGKQWHAQKEENIIISVVLNTSCLQASGQFGLSMAVALATYDFFLQNALSDASIKWPNDLYWRDRKAGGILIENIIQGKEWQWAVAGIGININQPVFDKAITNPVSLKQITGKNYQPVLLAKELCLHLEQRFLQLVNNGPDQLLTDYNNVLYKKGERIRLKKDSAVFDCTLKEVNLFGQLVVETSIFQTFNVGEVEWVIS